MKGDGKAIPLQQCVQVGYEEHHKVSAESWPFKLDRYITGYRWPQLERVLGGSFPGPLELQKGKSAKVTDSRAIEDLFAWLVKCRQCWRDALRSERL